MDRDLSKRPPLRDQKACPHPGCGRVFWINQPKAFKYHVRVCEFNPVHKKEPSVPEPEGYPCEAEGCDYVGVTRQQLSGHTLQHGAVAEIRTCKWGCGKKSRSGPIAQHEKVCPENPKNKVGATCDACGVVFRGKHFQDSLRAHNKRKHSRQTPSVETPAVVRQPKGATDLTDDDLFAILELVTGGPVQLSPATFAVVNRWLEVTREVVALSR